MPPTRLITVVETAPYLAMVGEAMGEAERMDLVNRIAADPSAGDLMPDTGGLRKLRVALPGRGRRGGGRVITYFHDLDMPVFLLAFYPKSKQDDLDPRQRRTAKALTDAIREQYGR